MMHGRIVLVFVNVCEHENSVTGSDRCAATTTNASEYEPTPVHYHGITASSSDASRVCQRSSVVEQQFRKLQVVGSIPTVGSIF